MAFEVIWQGEFAAGTYRDDESVVAQIAHVTFNGKESYRMEARVQDEKRGRSTKTAIVFDDPSEVEELITQLQSMVTEWRGQGLTNGRAVPAPAPEAIVQRRRKPNPAAPAAKRAAAAARKAPAKRVAAKR